MFGACISVRATALSCETAALRSCDVTSNARGMGGGGGACQAVRHYRLDLRSRASDRQSGSYLETVVVDQSHERWDDVAPPGNVLRASHCRLAHLCKLSPDVMSQRDVPLEPRGATYGQRRVGVQHQPHQLWAACVGKLRAETGTARRWEA